MPTRKRDSVSSSSTEGVVLNKDGSQRKSRLLSRKTDHSVIERRRREKMNEKLVTLQNLIPACQLECRAMIDRKFQPDEQADEAKKSERSFEREQRARESFARKTETTMVLEKLCIMSHTLDYVQQLQRENAALKNDRTAQTAVLQESDQSSPPPELVHEGSTSPEASPTSPGSDTTQLDRPACKKRRLHWGSNDIRKASIKVCTSHDPLDETESEEECEACKHGVEHEPSPEPQAVQPSRFRLPPVACTLSQPHYSCAKHSWCRASCLSPEVSNTETPSSSAPLDMSRRLPPLQPRYAPKDRLASIYRTHAFDSTHRRLAPLSLYTSGAPVRT